jgi:hypothetical protein
MTIDMHCCPSKGRLIQIKHMKPYHDYCGHCLVIYKKVLDKYGIVETRDHAHIDEARCYRTYKAGAVNPPDDQPKEPGTG